MLTPAKRFLVRTLLITGCTLSTLIGVQTLASLNAAKSSAPVGIVITPDESVRTETLVPMFDPPTSSTATGAAQAPQIQIITGPTGTSSNNSQAPAIHIVTAAPQVQRVNPNFVRPRTQQSR